MTLTADDLKALAAPFRMAEHSFLPPNKRGDEPAYLTEEVVTARLDSVDPSWEFRIEAERNSAQSTATGHLTIKGVTRANIGMQKVDDTFGEAEKGAATDALKRAARLFGVGRYLLQAPIKRRDFGPWLAEQQRLHGGAPQARQLAEDATQDRTPAKTPENAPAPVHASPDWAAVRRETAPLYDNPHEQNASIAKGLRDGWLSDTLSTEDAIEAIRQHREAKAAHWMGDDGTRKAFIDFCETLSVMTNKAMAEALANAVEYTVRKPSDFLGPVDEAEAAVIAYACRYDLKRIAALLDGMRTEPEEFRANWYERAKALIARRPLLTVQPEQIAVGAAS